VPPSGKKPTERDAVERCVATMRSAVAAALRIAPTEKLFVTVRAELDALATARGHECGATSASDAARPQRVDAQCPWRKPPILN